MPRILPTLISITILALTSTHCSTISVSQIWPPNQKTTNPTRIPVVVTLDDLAKKIDLRYPGTTVYKIRLADSDPQDRRATWFGSANEQVDSVCDQLAELDELSLGFDAIGLSQGGQLMRAYVERCNRPHVRNLITLGSQHMGVSGTAPCSGLFDLGCHVLHKLIESGTVYGPMPNKKYFRDQSNLAPYMKHNAFLRDINNERWNDSQPVDSGSHPIGEPEDGVEYEPRKEQYKLNFQSLENFVMFRFTHPSHLGLFHDPQCDSVDPSRRA
ncbi:hypothetical protein PGT21_024705 [Puccinia graminis f. sp. tritici]|uniref:Palmitoyl-protein thioesterase 1 n=1 Tax=Puccinia graminis f. sp. tritici TaxID=56615 RepID=A0A5B0LV83_PUCGR|nr:hypothetical protein PGT21_024705 [Puccinia graminis f. sp. tritici]